MQYIYYVYMLFTCVWVGSGVHIHAISWKGAVFCLNSDWPWTQAFLSPQSASSWEPPCSTDSHGTEHILIFGQWATCTRVVPQSPDMKQAMHFLKCGNIFIQRILSMFYLIPSLLPGPPTSLPPKFIIFLLSFISVSVSLKPSPKQKTKIKTNWIPIRQKRQIKNMSPKCKNKTRKHRVHFVLSDSSWAWACPGVWLMNPGRFCRQKFFFLSLSQQVSAEVDSQVGV